MIIIDIEESTTRLLRDRRIKELHELFIKQRWRAYHEGVLVLYSDYPKTGFQFTLRLQVRSMTIVINDFGGEVHLARGDIFNDYQVQHWLDILYGTYFDFAKGVR